MGKSLPGEKARLIPGQASNGQLRRLGLNICFQELANSRQAQASQTLPCRLA